MSSSFQPASGLAIVRADMEGAVGRAVLRAAIDTGSTYTTIDSQMLASVGIAPEPGTPLLQMRTVNSISAAQRVVISRFAALGKVLGDYSVISTPIRADLQIDALLGLDFFRGHRLTIDFNSGTIELI